MNDIEKQKYRDEYEALNTKLQDTSSINTRELGGLFSRQSTLHEIITVIDQIDLLQKQKSENDILITQNEDAEMTALAQEENISISEKLESAQKQLKMLTVKPDPNDSKNAIVEIRAGTGGEEASLFASELFRMYSRLSATIRWQIQVLSITDSESGGIKEVIFKVIGKDVYKVLKVESGVHRVQRVPATESAGRIHTSAASVVVMPEIDDIDVQINPSDLRIDVYRSGGHGGQSVNTTDSAVRITHVPSGLVVTCQDTKDQQKNKASAMSVLRSRLYQIELDKQNAALSDIRKTSIKTGDRSDKVKTYNFPQDRLTDHRIKKSWFGLDPVMDGEILDILNETLLDLASEE